jgi:hypothetical protein
MSDSPNPFTDPLKGWRDWFVQSERDWSEQLTRLMKDDNVARMLGQEIHAGLHKQQMLAQSLAGPLAAMNVPTREDLVAIGERIGRLEDAVARVEALMTRKAPSAGQRPARTRKPPAKDSGPARRRAAR